MNWIDAAAIIIAAGSSTAWKSSQENFLYHSNDMDIVRVDSERTRGTVGKHAFDFMVEKRSGIQGQFLFLSVASDGDKLGEYTLPLQQFPKLDIGSAMYFVRMKPDRTIKIELRFGDENECFVNDDGRDRLTAVFYSNRKPDVYKISYEDCEPNVKAL